MTLPSPAEVEHADWPTLKSYATELGLNPKGRSAIVRRRVLDHLRAHGVGAAWRPGPAEVAALLTRLGHGDAASRLWESTISLDAPAPWVGLGVAYLRAERLEEAVKCFDRAIQMGDPGARLHKAHALARSGRTDAALAEVDEAIAPSPNDVRPLATRIAYAEASGRADEVLLTFTRLSDLGLGRGGRARALMRAGRWEEAEKVLRLRVSEDDGDALAWSHLGVCLGKRGRWREAADALRKAASLAPEDPGVLNNLACALANSGREDEAVKRLEAAQRRSEDPRVLLNLGALRERARAPAMAREVYERALQVAPAHPEAVAARKRVAPKPRARKAAPKSAPKPKAVPRARPVRKRAAKPAARAAPKRRASAGRPAPRRRTVQPPKRKKASSPRKTRASAGRPAPKRKRGR